MTYYLFCNYRTLVMVDLTSRSALVVFRTLIFRAPRSLFFWTLIIINDPLIIINTRFARNIDVHTPQSAWAPTERKNVQLMEINV